MDQTSTDFTCTYMLTLWPRLQYRKHGTSGMCAKMSQDHALTVHFIMMELVLYIGQVTSVLIGPQLMDQPKSMCVWYTMQLHTYILDVCLITKGTGYSAVVWDKEACKRILWIFKVVVTMFNSERKTNNEVFRPIKLKAISCESVGCFWYCKPMLYPNCNVANMLPTQTTRDVCSLS